MSHPEKSATSGPRAVRAPRGTEISCKGWQQEAALRMLMNNLDLAKICISVLLRTDV